MGKLAWGQIKQNFEGEWVQLTDCDWDMTEPEPSAGVVNVHAKDAEEFHHLVKQNPSQDSAIIFVGDPFPSEPNVFFNANQQRWLNVRSR